MPKSITFGLGPEFLQRDGLTETIAPWEDGLRADTGRGRVHLALREPALIEAVSLLTAFPRWQQRLLRLLANPYYFRFNAALELQIDLPGLQAVEQGRALYEIMLLR